MLSIFVIVLGLVVLIVLVLASKQPDEFQVTRSASMSAPASLVFQQVNDLHKWADWSPWAKLDPNAVNNFAGPQAGVGASMSWSGNRKIGVGSMVILESCPDELIRFELAFLKPFKATNQAEFAFKTAGNETVVDWRMTGENKLMGKIMSLFMNCDKMVGTQFEQGLAAMKAIVEAAA